MNVLPSSFRALPLALSAALLFSAAGCKSTPAPATDDASLTTKAQTQLQGDSAISSQQIQASVVNGVVTLNGTVANVEQKTIAGRDVAGVTGVKEVMNNLTVQAGSSASVVTPPPALIPAAPAPLPTKVVPVKNSSRPEKITGNGPIHQPAPIERPQQSYNNPPEQYQPAPQQSAPPPPAQPVFRNVTIPSGDALPVRITQTLDTATTVEGSTFSGVVASDIVIDGLVAIPAGATVTGHVDTVHEAAHFKGSSLLTVSLTSVSRRGERIPVSTDPYSVEGKGRGKNTATKAGVGAVGGAILGGIFGGGKGAAIGAAAGGAGGAGINAVTKGEQVQISSESVVRFHLTAPITVRARADATRGGDGLQPR